MMKAQVLYDFRQKFKTLSGTELQDFFRSQELGPSPSGNIELPDKRAADELVNNSISAMRMNNPTLPEIQEVCDQAERAWRSEE